MKSQIETVCVLKQWRSVVVLASDCCCCCCCCCSSCSDEVISPPVSVKFNNVKIICSASNFNFSHYEHFQIRSGYYGVFKGEQIPRSITDSFKPTFNGDGTVLAEEVALCYWKRCVCYFCKYCNSSFDCFTRLLYFVQISSAVQVSIPDILLPTRKPRLGVFAEHQVPRLGFGLDERYRRSPSCGDLKMSILWWPECLLPMATWAPPFCGDFEILILLLPGDLHHMAIWRSPSYVELNVMFCPIFCAKSLS